MCFLCVELIKKQINVIISSELYFFYSDADYMSTDPHLKGQIGIVMHTKDLRTIYNWKTVYVLPVLVQFI